MDSHGLASLLEDVHEANKQIKIRSGSVEICDLADRNMSTVRIVVDALGLREKFDQIKERRIDPT